MDTPFLKNDSKLINYWSFNGNGRDETGDCHLLNGINTYATKNRLNKQNSAIRFKNGYYKIKKNYTLDMNELTVTGWIKLNSNENHISLIEINDDSDNGVSLQTLNENHVQFKYGNHCMKSMSQLKPKLWHHIVGVKNKTSLFLYINGKLDIYVNLDIDLNTIASFNYIGKSYDESSDASIDDIKIFNKSLSYLEILIDYGLSYIKFLTTTTKTYRPTIIVDSSGLINYWKFDGDFQDQIGNSDLIKYSAVNTDLTMDREGNYDSALELSNGYIQVPNGYYFSGQFTFTTWIKLKSKRSYARIIDFGDKQRHNVVISTNDYGSQIIVYIFDGPYKSELKSDYKMDFNKWTHLSVVVEKNGNTEIYFDGNLDKKGKLNVPRSYLRTQNFIGKSNWGNDNADECLDEIKIFNRALSEYEIKQNFNSSLLIYESSSKLFLFIFC
jgi:hypothetical protein